MEEVRPIDFIRRRILPWVMWGALITLAVWLYRGVGPGSPVKGFAEAQPFRLSSTEPARVESILVRAGDRVRAGEVVAILDATAIDAELRVIEADRARVLAELAKAEMEAKVARFDQTRGIVGDQDQVARAARDAKTRLETARAELRAVEAELGRRTPLVKQGVLTAQDLADLQIRKAALARQVAEEQAGINLLGVQAETAGTLLPPSETAWVDAVKAPLAEEVKVLDNQAALLRARRDQMVLRAPSDGIVTSVGGAAQSVITPGVALVEIVSDTSGRIVACIVEGQHRPIAPGATAVARPTAERSRELTGHSVSVSPVMELPSRCWRDPRVPMWGRVVTVELVPPTPLTPGETFEVRFDSGT